jgi:ferredoxin
VSAQRVEGREPTAAQGQELIVDRIRCDGFGMCAELLPEVVALDDWGYPIVARDPLADELLELARRAVAVCPVLALRLRPVPHATMAPAALARLPVASPGG